MKHPTWFSRWKVYPASCLGHVAQGGGAGVLGALGHEVAALVWFGGYVAYQGLSFARKVNTEGRGDTAGLDAFDFIVGFIPVYTAVAIARVV